MVQDQILELLGVADGHMKTMEFGERCATVMTQMDAILRITYNI